MTANRWCSNLTRLIVSWWNVDRIRISLEEGLWLALPIGSFVERHGDMFEVVDREDAAATGESLVGYRCVAGSQSARLLVTSGFASYCLTGDLSPWKTSGTNEESPVESRSLPKPIYRMYWEDRSGVHLVYPGDLTLWPKGKRKR